MTQLALLFFAITFTTHAFAASCDSKGPNVILMTWDGVRNQEFFKGTDSYHHSKLPQSDQGEIFSHFWKKHATKGVVLGEEENYQIASSVGVSLPSYQAIMVGRDTGCKNNECGQVKEETFLELIKKTLQLPVAEVAIFGSWEGMKHSVARSPEKLFTAIYPDVKANSFLDPEIIRLQKASLTDLPSWKESRKDHYTFGASLLYLKKHCPRFMYISLVDSDEYGHLDDYPGYVKILRTYDEYLERLIKTLKSMGAYGEQTTLFVTTDHSRGEGEQWKHHGYTEGSERNVFLFMTGRGVSQMGKIKANGHHGMIRPTVENLMGLNAQGENLPGLEFQ